MATAKPPPVGRKLWENPDPESTQLYKFTRALEARTSRRFPTYFDLHDFSTSHRAQFWKFCFDHFPLVYSGTVPEPVVDESVRMDSIPRWFQGVQVNFAENILFVGDKDGKPVKSPGKEDDKIACTQVREGSFLEPIKQVSWGELRRRVGRLAQAMRARGVRKGDRVALVASTCLDTLCVFLATTSLGGIFSSSSTDMGSRGVLERLWQIKPKFVFVDDVSVYNGKTTDLRDKMKEIVEGMMGTEGFEGIISQARFEGKPADVSDLEKVMSWKDFVSAAKSDELIFERVEWSEPFLIVYSSGTTGQPKCIVHGTGGVILNGHKEARLHRSVDHTSTQLQYTTTGWIMYLGSVQQLLMGCRMVMYDGSPFLPDLKTFIRLLGQERVTHFGTSPRYMQTLQMANVSPRETADLSHLHTVTTTGMVLSDALFEWFYDTGFPKNVQLDNISGGTDLAGAFGTGNPNLPIYVGGCQCISLGMAVEVFDQEIEGGKGIRGKAVEDGVPGELVCTKSFPTMPVKFWGENGSQRYFSSYFEKYDDCWTHGDFIMVSLPALVNLPHQSTSRHSRFSIKHTCLG
jgi:acetoacetyl-CoA synthetase